MPELLILLVSNSFDVTHTDYLENVATSLSNLLSRTMKIEDTPKRLESLDLAGIAKYLLTCRNIIFMTGAGISTGKSKTIIMH